MSSLPRGGGGRQVRAATASKHPTHASPPPHRRDHGALGADNHMGLEPESLDPLHHVSDFRLSGCWFHDDNHAMVS